MALYQVRIGALDAAADAANCSVQLLESVGDRAVIFEARSVLVTVAQLAGRLDDAEALVEEMSDAACEANVRHYEEWCCTRLGFIRTARGDIERGEALHRSALAIGADPWADAHAHLGLAVCARRCGDLDAARKHCDRALAIHQRVGAHIEQAYIHILRAWTELDAGNPDEARRLADLAEATDPAASIEAMATEVRAALAAAAGDPDEARQLLARADGLAPIVGHAVWWLTRPDIAAINERVGSPTA
jgi:tetratricopeptide (TPR) repeat protein